MLPSLARSTVRAATRRTNYVCLACRANHQLVAERSTESTSGAPPELPASERPTYSKRGRDLKSKAVSLSIQHAFEDALRSVNARRSKGSRVAPAQITFAGDGEKGYTAVTDVDGERIESPLCETKSLARTKVRLLALEHMQQKSGPIAKLEAGADKEESQTVLQEAPPKVEKQAGTLRDRQRQRRALRRRIKDDDGLVRSGSSLRVKRVIDMKGATLHPLEGVQRLSSARAEMEETEDAQEVQPKDKSSSGKLAKDLKLSPHAQTFEPLELKSESLDIPTKGVPSLSYGLDRVLFNPGVYHVQDPRSRVYNFDPYLQKIIHPKNFDFAVLDEFRTPSADNTLSSVAEDHKIQYFSSTSAVTGVLSHMHFLLSNFRKVNLEDLSAGFVAQKRKYDDDKTEADFTTFFKSPQSIYLKPKNGGYAIDKADDQASTGLLSFVGQCLEKLFTVSKEVFEMYKKSSNTKPEPMGNGYHYTKFDSILVRSQLDAHDDRLPGTGMFDIKTRAALPIRMDSLETTQDVSKNYEIKHLHGEFESFEREFHDMSRATMLKYSLQARLGRMDGIFVAYHNIARIFGFQYLSLADIDKVLHGQTDTVLGDAELNSSMRILSGVFDRAVKLYPDEPLRLYFEAYKGARCLNVFVVPVTAEEIERQHEDAQRLSREYLARLNEPESTTKLIEDVEGDLGDSASVSTATSPGATTTSLPNLGDAGESSIDSSQDTWLKTSETDAVSSTEGGQEDASEDPSKAEELGEEIERLDGLADGISRETQFIHSEGLKRRDAKIQKMIITDIARQTFTLETEIEKLAEVADEGNEDLKALRQRLEDQKQVNKDLLEAAEEQSVLTDNEVQGLTSGQTLKQYFETVNRRYTPPERYSAFEIKAQSQLNGALLNGPPSNVHQSSKWELTYTIEELSTHKANIGYAKMLKRKDNATLSSKGSKQLRQYYDGTFFQKLMNLSLEGKEWREKRDREDEGREVVVFEPKN